MSAIPWCIQAVSATPVAVYRQGFEAQGLSRALIEPQRNPVGSPMSALADFVAEVGCWFLRTVIPSL